MSKRSTQENRYLQRINTVIDHIHEGESCLAGFASRKGDITLYLATGFPGHEEFLSKLGKHKMGKGCLYIRTLSDVDLKILEQLVVESFAERKRHYG